MKTKKIVTAVMAILPFIYLAIVWNQIPAEVPIHWNIKGEVDGYGSKTTLIAICFFLTTFTYLIFEFLPRFNEKIKSISQSEKYQNFELLIVSLMSVLSLFIIYNSMHAEVSKDQIFNIVTGAIFMVIGNYMGSIPQNALMGVRTKWSMENKENWKKSNRLGGLLFFITGLITILSSFIFNTETTSIIMFVSILLAAAITIFYSYSLSKKE